MGLESTIERIADHMSKGEELLDEDFENLKKSLEINYDKYKDKDLYEYILDQFEDNNIELVETDKEELKKIIDILEHKKSETRDENPQTKLQLDHKKYKNSLVESINYFLGED